MPEVTYDRVNWKDSPDTDTPINATNLNKMDKGIADCTAKVNECFQSASEGKTLIASALTGKGQASTSADTYAQMAAKINNLMAVPTATKSITSNGSNIDVTNYAKVNVSVKSYYIQSYIQFDSYTEYQAVITRDAYKGYSGVAFIGSSGGSTYVNGYQANLGGALPRMSYNPSTGTVYLNLPYNQSGQIRFIPQYGVPSLSFILYK